MKKLSILTVLVMLVTVTAYSVSGTYAKYTSEFTGSDSATVAKWAFTIDGKEVNTANSTFTYNLFDHADENTMDTRTTTDEDGETTTVKLVAPGTTGNTNIALVNASEVSASYSITYTITNTSNLPIEFCTADDCTAEDAEWVLADAVDAKTGTFTVKAAGEDMNPNSTANAGLSWRWAFTGADSTNFTTSQTDVTDTAFGEAGNATITVEATVNVEQID